MSRNIILGMVRKQADRKQADRKRQDRVRTGCQYRRLGGRNVRLPQLGPRCQPYHQVDFACLLGPAKAVVAG